LQGVRVERPRAARGRARIPGGREGDPGARAAVPHGKDQGRGVGRPARKARTMAKDAIVSEDMARKFATETAPPYTQWVTSEGRGSTSVWNDAGARITFEWKKGAIFAIPLNAMHQHFNASGTESARFVSVTNAPMIINAFGDIGFIFGTKYDFKDRFSGEPDYFANKGEQKGLLLDTNFVADAINLPLIAAKERGAGGGHIRFSMAKGSMNSHISQFP